jgi:hypothetical protein
MKMKYNNETFEVKKLTGLFRDTKGRNWSPIEGNFPMMRGWDNGSVEAEAINPTDHEKELWVNNFAHHTIEDHNFITSMEEYKA